MSRLNANFAGKVAECLGYNANFAGKLRSSLRDPTLLAKLLNVSAKWQLCWQSCRMSRRPTLLAKIPQAAELSANFAVAGSGF